MRTTIDENNFSTVKTLIGAGLKNTRIAEITGISAPTIYRIKAAKTYQEFDDERKGRILRMQMESDAKKQTSEVKTTGTIPVAATAEGLIAAVTRVALALEKNNEILEDIYGKLGDSQVSLQELVNAWGSDKNQKPSLF